MNRLIELVTPRIFDMNQKLLNYAINDLIVPKINQILTMFSVVVSKTKNDGEIDDNTAIYLHELDDKTVIQYLRKYPIQMTDNFQFINLFFNNDFSTVNRIKGKSDEIISGPLYNY